MEGHGSRALVHAHKAAPQAPLHACSRRTPQRRGMKKPPPQPASPTPKPSTHRPTMSIAREEAPAWRPAPSRKKQPLTTMVICVCTRRRRGKQGGGGAQRGTCFVQRKRDRQAWRCHANVLPCHTCCCCFSRLLLFKEASPCMEEPTLRPNTRVAWPAGIAMTAPLQRAGRQGRTVGRACSSHAGSKGGRRENGSRAGRACGRHAGAAHLRNMAAEKN